MNGMIPRRGKNGKTSRAANKEEKVDREEIGERERE